ncbi:hypothetical protein JIY74_24685 [Vibrio harveyi]|nr:hypothetical protein [Vibrio harveyi]
MSQMFKGAKKFNRDISN